MNDRWKEAFDEIHAESELKEKTKAYLAGQIRCRRRRMAAMGRRIAAAACLAFILLAGGSWLYLTPTVYIAVDVNPSLELGINRFDRVVSVEAYNEDGQALASSLQIRFMNYQDALEEILNEEIIEILLSEDGVLSLTVTGDGGAQNDEVLAGVESCAAGHQNVHCHSGSSAEREEALEAGLSLGKYRAYCILHELDPTVTPDDVRDLSMREIADRIEALGGQDIEWEGHGHGHGHEQEH